MWFGVLDGILISAGRMYQPILSFGPSALGVSWTDSGKSEVSTV